MQIFNTDIENLSRQKLPTFLRGSIMLSCVQAAVYPLFLLVVRFRIFRDSNLYRLFITPQVWALEKLLNDRYNAEFEYDAIYITDGEFRGAQYIWLVVENRPMYIYMQQEIDDSQGTENLLHPQYIYKQSEAGFLNETFVIHVPQALMSNSSEIAALVRQYCLPVKNFGIVGF
jgi:hypothetical protein